MTSACTGKISRTLPALILLFLLFFNGYGQPLQEHSAVEKKIYELLKQVDKLDDKRALEQKLRIYAEALEVEKQLHRPTQATVDLHRHFAGFLHSNGAIQFAIKHEKVALDTLEKLEANKPSGGQYYMLGMIGSSFLLQEQYDSAAFYYKKAVRVAERMNSPKEMEAGRNNLGMLYQRAGYPDSAIACYQSALAIAENPADPDPGFAHSIVDNLAEVYALKKQYDKALQYYLKNLDIAQRHKDHLTSMRRVQARLGMAEMYLQLAKPAEAWNSLQVAGSEIGDIKNSDRYKELNTRLKWGRLAYFITVNKKAEADRALADIKLDMHRRSLDREVFLDKALKDFMQISLERVEHELDMRNALLKAETEQNRLNRWLLIMGAVASGSLILILWLGLRRRMQAQKKKIEFEKLNAMLNATKLKNKELEANQLKFELEYKKRDLEGIAMHSSFSSRVTHDMLDRLKEISKLPGNEMGTEIKKYVTQVQVQLQSDEKKTVLAENIEEVNQQFFQTLKKAFPNLTASEIELCGLIRMNMSGKEISNLRNISPASVKMSRNRLRKKLGLSPETDLYDFIISFGTNQPQY